MWWACVFARRCPCSWQIHDEVLGMRYHDGWNLLPNDLAKGNCMSIYRERGIRLRKLLTVGKSRCGIHWCSLCCFFSNIPIDLSFLKYKLNFRVRLLFLPSFSFWWPCSIRLGTFQFYQLFYTHFIYNFLPIHVFYVSY